MPTSRHRAWRSRPPRHRRRRRALPHSPRRSRKSHRDNRADQPSGRPDGPGEATAWQRQSRWSQPLCCARTGSRKATGGRGFQDRDRAGRRAGAAPPLHRAGSPPDRCAWPRCPARSAPRQGVRPALPPRTTRAAAALWRQAAPASVRTAAETSFPIIPYREPILHQHVSQSPETAACPSCRCREAAGCAMRRKFFPWTHCLRAGQMAGSRSIDGRR